MLLVDSKNIKFEFVAGEKEADYIVRLSALSTPYKFPLEKFPKYLSISYVIQKPYFLSESVLEKTRNNGDKAFENYYEDVLWRHLYDVPYFRVFHGKYDEVIASFTVNLEKQFDLKSKSK